MNPKLDLSGRRFGRLVVIALAPKTGMHLRWQCICDCGRVAFVESSRLRGDHTKSCGCLRIDAPRISNTIHGQHGSRTYSSWRSMRERCLNPKARGFKYWGGAGVRICSRWEAFENFLADMGERPHGTSLDRYPDPHGDYEPRNCRWATAAQQARNRRQRILIEKAEGGA